MSIDVCFIGGFGRSGSTLLERLLGELPSVCSLGEVVHLWVRGVGRDEPCSCGADFSRCEFWREVGDLAFGGWKQVDLRRVVELRDATDRTRFIPAAATARAASGRAAAMREYADYHARVYAAARKVSGASVVTDSSKNASTAFVLHASGDIDLRVLHMIRDSRGVAYSWTKEVARPEADGDSVKPLMDRYPPWEAAMLWNAHNLAFDALRRRGVSTLRVGYERIVADPARAIREVAQFLDVESCGLDDFINADSVTLTRSHLVAGNPMRFQTGELRLRRDDAWRQRLDPRARGIVSLLTSPLMLRYGYLRRGSR